MDLTAILACKDRERNLRYCLASIANSTNIPKTILVDFGSNRPLKHYQKKYKNWLRVIRVTRNTKLFHKTRALNIGIRHSTTTYVCMTDIDQVFHPNFFGTVFHTLCNAKRPIFVRCVTYFLQHFPRDLLPSGLTRQAYRSLLNRAKNGKFKKPHGEGCCHGVDRDWLISVRGHDEKYIGWGFEDKDIVLRAQHCGYKMCWVSGKTNMVHLPHERNSEYFGYVHRKKNENRYRHKLRNVVAEVNIGSPWGKV